MNTLIHFQALLADRVRDVVAARKRRREQEQAFYRNLNDYCRAHDLPSICEDDWKTAAYDKN
jgi:hypothetical protein